jgi:hypothetical protein
MYIFVLFSHFAAGLELRKTPRYKGFAGVCNDAASPGKQDWGSKGRRFESCRPDFSKPLSITIYAERPYSMDRLRLQGFACLGCEEGDLLFMFPDNVRGGVEVHALTRIRSWRELIARKDGNFGRNCLRNVMRWGSAWRYASKRACLDHRDWYRYLVAETTASPRSVIPVGFGSKTKAW